MTAAIVVTNTENIMKTKKSAFSEAMKHIQAKVEAQVKNQEGVSKEEGGTSGISLDEGKKKKKESTVVSNEKDTPSVEVLTEHDHVLQSDKIKHKHKQKPSSDGTTVTTKVTTTKLITTETSNNVIEITRRNAISEPPVALESLIPSITKDSRTTTTTADNDDDDILNEELVRLQEEKRRQDELESALAAVATPIVDEGPVVVDEFLPVEIVPLITTKFQNAGAHSATFKYMCSHEGIAILLVIKEDTIIPQAVEFLDIDTLRINHPDIIDLKFQQITPDEVGAEVTVQFMALKPKENYRFVIHIQCDNAAPLINVPLAIDDTFDVLNDDVFSSNVSIASSSLPDEGVISTNAVEEEKEKEEEEEVESKSKGSIGSSKKRKGKDKGKGKVKTKSVVEDKTNLEERIDSAEVEVEEVVVTEDSLSPAEKVLLEKHRKTIAYANEMLIKHSILFITKIEKPEIEWGTLSEIMQEREVIAAGKCLSVLDAAKTKNIKIPSLFEIELRHGSNAQVRLNRKV